MKLWKIVYYTGEEDFRTGEIIVNDKEYEKIQEILSKGGDLIILKNKATIKRSSIASINDYSQEAAEYQRMGVSIAGLPSNFSKQIEGRKETKEEERERIDQRLRGIKNYLSKKLGWK